MSEIKLTEKDLKILELISINCGSMSPTQIGMAMGQSYNSASSYCSSSLKRLMAAGKIVKITTDRVRYKLKQPQK
jgi:DNA-binding CsgD family transcriptional regulator